MSTSDSNNNQQASNENHDNSHDNSHEKHNENNHANSINVTGTKHKPKGFVPGQAQSKGHKGLQLSPNQINKAIKPRGR